MFDTSLDELHENDQTYTASNDRCKYRYVWKSEQVETYTTKLNSVDVIYRLEQMVAHLDSSLAVDVNNDVDINTVSPNGEYIDAPCLHYVEY